tara:strand:+ start:539 stop:985 length:447 start_codon:yes stop_codon:yes gene_type:complete
MNNYLLKWSCNDKQAYKTGISKSHSRLLEDRFGKSSKFHHPGYDLFKIEELASVYCSSESYSLARAAAFGMEHAFKALCPKDFQLEEHFDLPSGTLDGMGGITEFFLLPDYLTEDRLIEIFNRANDNVWQLNKKLKSYHGTVSAEMNF